jgi:hypothetical protein
MAVTAASMTAAGRVTAATSGMSSSARVGGATDMATAAADMAHAAGMPAAAKVRRRRIVERRTGNVGR